MDTNSKTIKSDITISHRQNGIGLDLGLRRWLDRQESAQIIQYLERILAGEERAASLSLGGLDLLEYAGYVQFDTPTVVADLNKSQLPKLLRVIKRRYVAAFGS